MLFEAFSKSFPAMKCDSTTPRVREKNYFKLNLATEQLGVVLGTDQNLG